MYIASDGHNNYIRSLARLIPKMMDLKHTHTVVHTAFMKGIFSVRRTDCV